MNGMRDVVSGSVELSCHVGGTIYNLARYYPTLQSVVDELIQNALDAGATQVQLKVNQKTRFIAIRDNGLGIGQKSFEEKVSQSIGHTLKTKDELGQFGIGFISPVGKCSHFVVTSCPKPKRNGYVSWRFAVEADAKDVAIDWSVRKDLAFAPDQIHVGSGRNVWWRTSIEIYEFTKDKTLSEISLNGITDSALMKFSSRMEKLGTKLRVDFVDTHGKEDSAEVTAATFSGTKLPEQKYQRGSSGQVIIRMYLAKRHVPGRVNIKFGELGNDFRFPFSNFRNSTAKDLLSAEVMEALRGGIFEGEVLGELVKLTPSRTCFERDDALIDLCICLEEWFAEQGSQYLDREKRERQKERYQDIGHKALSRLDHLLRDSATGSDLKAALRQFLIGTTGPGHTKIAKEGDSQEEKSMAVKGSGSKKGKGEERERTEARRELNEPHLSSRGPKGSQRRIVKGGSFGLQFAYDELPDSPNLWELDIEDGVLVFNTMHPDWVACDTKGESDWRLCSLMEFVAIGALTLLSMPDKGMRTHQRIFSDELTKHFVGWLLLGGGMPLGRSRH